jgi:hypothetical protein
MVEFIWWVGVVEDRNDPEKLGRCKVRIFGYHTEDKTILPTDDLPWAIPIQPINSASVSGIGFTPVGIVTGTWVTGWFLDGEDKQQPVMLGTIPGKTPAREEAKEKQKQDSADDTVLKDNTGSPIYEESGNFIFKSAEVTSLRNSFDPLKPTDIDILFNSIANKVSSNNQTKIGTNNELGKYQFTISDLMVLGYLRLPSDGNILKEIVDDRSFWVGLNGITSKQEFLSNRLLQEEAMLRLTKSNYDKLISLDKISTKDDPKVIAGFLASAHVFGVTGADDLERKDAYGRQAKEFFNLGVVSLGGNLNTDIDIKYSEVENYLPEINDGNITNEDLALSPGFSDPNRKYPKYEYEGLSDINKLAVGNRSHLLFKIKEAQKTENIQIGRAEKRWSEPEPAYAASYPYNQVIETEAGHVIELDSTPNAERIHIFHKKGTYIEIDVNGTMVRKVLGDNYEVLDRNNFVYVKGANNLTVEGKTSIYVKDNAVIEVDGDVSVTGHRDAVVQAARNLAVSGKNLVLSGKDGVNIVSDGAINLQAGSDININSKNNLSLQATGTISIKASINLLMDAILVKTQMGANFVKDLVIRAFDPPELRNPVRSSVPVLERTSFFQEDLLFDAGEEEGDEWRRNREATGETSKFLKVRWELPPQGKSYRSTQPSTRVSCDVCNQFGRMFPRSFKLSKNFTIEHMLTGDWAPQKVQAQRGLSEKQIVCNAMQIAENCLEPLLKRYPRLKITSWFRDVNILDENGKSVGMSDHGLAAAVDIQVNNLSLQDHLSVAHWCLSNIPYRQLLFEYKLYPGSADPRTAWIHIALLLDENGKIIESSKPPVQTWQDDRPILVGLPVDV